MTERVLVTVPPMLGMIDEFYPVFKDHGLEGVAADVVAELTEDELVEILPEYDGWIVGDDPVTRRVLEAGKAGKLRACLRWGIGTDNVDFEACKDLGIPIVNTPGVFGREVADVAMTYVLGLARQTYFIDKEIKDNATWPKPPGLSTWNCTAAIIGFGDIGRNTAKRLLSTDMKVKVYDPFYKPVQGLDVTPMTWPQGLEDVDFLVFTAPLNPATHHMFNHDLLPKLKPGVRVVNVGRGPLVQETALLEGLETGIVHSAALDVFEVEPMEKDSPLRKFDRCIFGSHNGSNTADAVRFVSIKAISVIKGFLDETRA